MLVAPAMATHLDEDNYESALDFDPFRYVKQQVEGTGGGLQQFVSTSSAYVAFGLGRHAWYVAIAAVDVRLTDQ